MFRVSSSFVGSDRCVFWEFGEMVNFRSFSLRPGVTGNFIGPRYFLDLLFSFGMKPMFSLGMIATIWNREVERRTKKLGRLDAHLRELIISRIKQVWKTFGWC